MTEPPADLRGTDGPTLSIDVARLAEVYGSRENYSVVISPTVFTFDPHSRPFSQCLLHAYVPVPSI